MFYMIKHVLTFNENNNPYNYCCFCDLVGHLSMKCPYIFYEPKQILLAIK